MAPVRADRDALLRNWKSAAAEIAADVTTLAAEAEALGAALAKQLEADGAAAVLKPGTRPITYSEVMLDADEREREAAPAAKPAAAE